MKDFDCLTSDKLQFKILAPAAKRVPSAVFQASVDANLHRKLVTAAQRLRGSVYREYAPIANQLLPDGRHYQPVDLQSWHVLLESGGRIVGCSRYRPVGGGFQQLGASRSSLAGSAKYGPILKRAIEIEIQRARNIRVQYGEAGAWALQPEVRCSAAAVNIALMTFALAERLGGGLGITTATTRHHSSSILRRLGGRRLAQLPPYYDAKYGCIIEILGFDMANLDSQFAARVDSLRKQLDRTEVICASGTSVSECSRARPAYQTPLRLAHIPHALAS